MEVDDVRMEVERTGVMAYLKDALAVLLEVRPADPLLFLNAYFKNAAQPDDLASLAWYLIRACPRSRPCFHDNLHSAFSALVANQAAPATFACGDDANTRGSETIPGADFMLLLRTLCSSLPPEVSKTLLDELPFSDSKPVPFADFVAAVEACVAAEDALRVTSELFKACDRSGHGSVPRDQLLAEIESQRRIEQQQRLQQPNAEEAPSAHELRAALSNEAICSAAGTDIPPHADGEAPPGGLANFEGLSTFRCFSDFPTADALRSQLLDFEAEDGVTVADLFTAMWRLWLQGEHRAVGGPPPTSASQR